MHAYVMVSSDAKDLVEQKLKEGEAHAAISIELVKINQRQYGYSERF